MTYTERLNILAEKMAKEVSPYSSDAQIRKLKIRFLPLAIIALQEISEIVEQAYIDGYSDCTNSTTVGIDAAEYINSLGLVPDKK